VLGWPRYDVRDRLVGVVCHQPDANDSAPGDACADPSGGTVAEDGPAIACQHAVGRVI